MSTYKLTERESLFLDGLRALASQAVVIGHAMSYFGIARFMHEPNFPWIQNIAVVVFFVMSGIVITYSTMMKSENPSYSLGRFVIDRFSRIFTALIPALMLIALIDYTVILITPEKYLHYRTFDISNFMANLFMVPDFPYGMFDLTSFGSGAVLWTVAIEWWIYICFGVLFFVFSGRTKLSPLIIAIFIWSAILPINRMFDGRGNGLTIIWVYGMLLFIAYPYYKKRVGSLSLSLLIFVSALALCIHRQTEVVSGYDKYFALYSAMLVMSLMTLSNSFALEKLKWSIKLTASYSFTLYLVHYSILEFLYTAFPTWGGMEKFMTGFIVANIAAFGLSRVTEVRMTPWVKRHLVNAFYPTKKDDSRAESGA